MTRGGGPDGNGGFATVFINIPASSPLEVEVVAVCSVLRLCADDAACREAGMRR